MISFHEELFLTSTFVLLIVNSFFCWMGRSFSLKTLKFLLNILFFSFQKILNLSKLLFRQIVGKYGEKYEKSHLFHGLYLHISAELHSNGA